MRLIPDKNLVRTQTICSHGKISISCTVTSGSPFLPTRVQPYTHLLLQFFFSHQLKLMVFHQSLSDSKSPQVSRTLISILTILSNVVVWKVSNRPPTSKSSCPVSNPLVTVPNAPITIDIIVTCMFHSFFQFLSKVEVLILPFTFFQFYSVVSWDSKVDNFSSFC